MQRQLRRHAAFVLVGGLAFTAIVVGMLVTATTQRDRQAFEANARSAQDAVLDRIETSIALLRGTAGLLTSRDEDPTVLEFRAYMNRVALRDLYPGILGIGYSKRIAPGEHRALESAMQSQGHEGFRIWPLQPRPEWHTIVFLEPLDARNRAAIGYDMFTHPVRREAMERARDSGQAAASAVVELVQEIDERKQPGFLIYLPVYRGGTAPASVEERRERLRGFTYAPIRAEDFLSSAFSHETRPSVAFRISHGLDPRARTVLYERRGSDPARALYHLHTQADVAGQIWQFDFWSEETLGRALIVPVLIGVAGIGVSFALATLLWREDHVRHAIQAALAREQAARSQAERANRMKDEFLATLSHELRTPLTAIVGWASVLRSGRLGPIETAGALETIDRNAKAQAHLIDDLLDTNRIVSGKLGLELHALDAAAVVDAAIDTVAPLARQKSVALAARIPVRPLVVRGDSGRLQQVAWNLLSNAIKFTPAGGHIDVTLEARGDRVRLAVADTGEGIDAQFIEHIFDRFSQADGAITRRHGGLGLGLAIVRELVALHGGSVSAHSDGAGKGTTFVVELPASGAGIDPAALEPQRPTETMLAGVEVLVVDDEPDARTLLRTLLEQRGARVQCVASAQEALAALDRYRPDVLVSDIGMADIDGYELLRRVRTRPREDGGAIPAIALTAYARDEDRVEALRAGFAYHLVKPIQPERLMGAICALVPTRASVLPLTRSAGGA